MSYTEIPFLTHEIGSLRKPTAFIKAGRNQLLTEEDISSFVNFLELIDFQGDRSEINSLLKESGPSKSDNVEYHKKLAEWRVHLNVKYKESTGIDIIDSGEWTRREMYQHFVDNEAFKGVKIQNHVRSFDYNFYKPGVYSPPVVYDNSKDIHLQEYDWAYKYASKPLKVCITAFNTVAEWSYVGSGNFDDFIFDLIDTVYVPETIKLLKAGVKWIQMDEPALTTHPEHVDTFVDAWNYWHSKIKSYTDSDTILGLHNCFSDYDLLWPILPELNDLGAITLEFANRDTWELGLDNVNRKAFADVIKPIGGLYSEEIGLEAKSALGVLPVHTDHETSPDLIRDRLLYINKFIEDPRLVLAAPDCGLRQRTLEVSHVALSNLAKGAQLARDTL